MGCKCLYERKNIFSSSFFQENRKRIIEENKIDKPVKVVPLGVNREIFTPLGKYQEKHPTIFRFLNMGKFELRKGHMELVDWFNKAFSTYDDVELIMAIHNRFIPEQVDEFEKYVKTLRLGHKIQIIKNPLRTQYDVATLMNQCDCGIFPSKAEGWNLELLECMSMGLPVIATNYSGHTEFCTEFNSMLIDVDEVEPAFHEPWFYGQGNWAKLGKKQEEQCIDYMKTVFSMEGIFNNQCEQTANNFSWSNSADKLLEAI